jgi:hypothetical protein
MKTKVSSIERIVAVLNRGSASPGRSLGVGYNDSRQLPFDLDHQSGADHKTLMRPLVFECALRLDAFLEARGQPKMLSESGKGIQDIVA